MAEGLAIPTPDPLAFLQTVSAHVLLWRCLGVVAELRVADSLTAGPRTAAALADECSVDARSLHRVLRLVASYGFFAEDEEGCFSLTPSGQLLGSMADALYPRLRLPWQDVLLKSYAALPETVRTGEPGFDLAFGEPIFQHLAAHPGLNAIFDASMARFSAHENTAIASAFPFQNFPTVVDVGGGQGGLLAAVLERHPGVAGVLFDQPQVVARPEHLDTGALQGRWRAESGDFFRRVPALGNLYVLKRIIHDWTDEQAGTILRNVAAALRAKDRVLVIDAVMRPGSGPDPNKFMDVNIMALTRGRERTEAEFRVLLSSAGLKLLSVAAPGGLATVSMLEAARA